LKDLRGRRGAAIFQGMDGVSVTFFVHAAKIRAASKKIFRRLRQYRAIATSPSTIGHETAFGCVG
jgi:predicted LPLAT superfamily acyltransferase